VGHVKRSAKHVVEHNVVLLSHKDLAMSLRRPALVIGLISCLWCGCQSKNPLGRLPLSGEVTLDGAPLDQGQIVFSPLQTEGKLVNSSAIIVAGKYELPAESGLLPGPYRVVISSTPKPGAGPVDPIKAMEAPPPPPVERIPAKYNVESELKIDVQKQETPNTFNFDLKSKP
jgi:hypothetical protein